MLIQAEASLHRLELRSLILKTQKSHLEAVMHFAFRVS